MKGRRFPSKKRYEESLASAEQTSAEQQTSTGEVQATRGRPHLALKDRPRKERPDREESAEEERKQRKKKRRIKGQI